ncbi:MAG TPA: glycosyltransferase family 4 protein [Candidatus Saccharimonadales bacterium]|nr:glycosyltransferase family 4 protein [Candidatus Saccharimonadales bacterium]
MKLLVVAPYYAPKIGGLENYARQLGIALRDIKKWEVVVVTSNYLGRKSIIDVVDAMKIYRLGTLCKLSNTPINPFWPFAIRRIIRKERPDFILAHTPVPSMADASALAAGRTPFILAYHAATLQKGDSPLFNLVAQVYGWYETITLRRAARILAVSDFVKATFPAKLQHKVRVLPNAVWARDVQQRAQPEQIEFLFIGSLDRTHAWKGLEDILRALAVYQREFTAPFVLSVMGDGNDRPRYERLAAALGLQDCVQFLGAQTGAEKEATIRRATALVMYPTTANDAFPTVMLEAWARYVPVVAAAIGPIPSLIHDGIDGLLVPPHQPGELAHALHTVASSSRAARAHMAQAAAQRVHDAYTWERQAAALAEIVKELL